MKNWHLWCSVWMPPGGTVAQFLQLPARQQGSQEPGSWQGQSAVPASPRHWRTAVPRVCHPRVFFLGAQGGGGAPLAL